MAGNSSAKAHYCYVCGKKACQGPHNGACKKCHKRLEQECTNLFFPVAKTIGVEVRYEWFCGDCWNQ